MSKFFRKRALAKGKPATRISIEVEMTITEFHSRKLVDRKEFKNDFYLVFDDDFREAKRWLKSDSSGKEIRKFLKSALKRSAKSAGGRR